MSNISDLRITVNNVNSLLENAGSKQRLRVTRSYGKVRLELDGEHYESIRAIGPKDCLKFAEGMEKALEMTFGW